MKFRKKPVVIEAARWDGYVAASVDDPRFGLPWDMPPRTHAVAQGAEWVLVIPTLEGSHFARPGDWIIRGVKGEFYPVKDDIFRQTYEAVEGPTRCACGRVELHGAALAGGEGDGITHGADRCAEAPERGGGR